MKCTHMPMLPLLAVALLPTQLARATDPQGQYYLDDRLKDGDIGALYRDPTRSDIRYNCDTWLKWRFLQPGSYVNSIAVESVYFHFWSSPVNGEEPTPGLVNFSWLREGEGTIASELLDFPDDTESVVPYPPANPIAYGLFAFKLDAPLLPEVFEGEEIHDLAVKTVIQGGNGFIKLYSGPYLNSFIIINPPAPGEAMNVDTDGDGLSDDAELYSYYTDPQDPDTDDDGKTDYEEVMAPRTPTDPNDYRQATLWSSPMGAPTTLYVDEYQDDPVQDGSWSHPYASIEEALAAADNVVERIVVRDGVYRGPLNTNLDLRGHEVELRSANGPFACTIDCERASNTRAFSLGNTGATLIEGFTVERGSATLGGGMYLGVGSTVRDCVFKDCTATDGGAIYAAGGAQLITHCRFLENIATDEGGGVALNVPQFAVAAPSLSLLNCLFLENEADTGAGAYLATQLPTTATITNCTFDGNLADAGSSLYLSGVTTTARSNIFWNERDAEGVEIDLDRFAALQFTLDIAYCDLLGGIAGIGGQGGAGQVVAGPYNPHVVPQFANMWFFMSDHHLLYDAQMVDQGDPAGVAWLTDLDGRPRIVDGDDSGTDQIDRGVYEHPGQ